jgi:L-2-hydroxyglutarate oxidase LhgO
VTERLDCVVIGAGVIGLAVARALALAGREVVVLERAASFGTETSSRNSEVIHAGIYYPQGSLKARFCVAGKHALYGYCAERGVPHKRTGKLIVATAEVQRARLESYKAAAAANGVPDLAWIDAAELKRMEPAVAGIGALLSPSTGIIDSHSYMLTLLGDLEHAGGTAVFHSPVTGGRITEDGIELTVGGEAATTVTARTVVNAAGLWAQELLGGIAGFPPVHIPPRYIAIGHYFTLAGKSPFTRLVYPVAEEGGLGVHVTLDMGGQARFGPDVTWIETLDYSFDASRKDRFAEAIRRYYPGLDETRLQPGYTGIRPKLAGQSMGFGDFRIDGPRDHGVTGLVNLFGIESPGLTASLAIADYVAELEA